MTKGERIVLIAAAALNIFAISAWQATGGDWYTKYEMVEQIRFDPDPNDPLAAAGFYDGAGQTQTITRREFHYGLLPAPARLLDKHVVSVATLVIFTWLIVITLFRLRRGRNV